jgi:alkylmercury lyase-like protein
MLFFRDEEHVARWCRAWRQPRGAVLDLNTAWRLADAWYGVPRNRRDWRRYSPDEVAAIFARLGLTGEFWSS